MTSSRSILVDRRPINRRGKAWTEQPERSRLAGWDRLVRSARSLGENR